MVKIFIITLLLLGLAQVSYCETILENEAVVAIIGEASGEGYEGMLAVAAAIRNRGTLKGVYGRTAGHVYNEPPWVWDLARKAWRQSAYYDPTKGGTHWESIKFKKPYWASSMDVTCQIKNHVFYKERS